jgi:hypothetical protein
MHYFHSENTAKTSKAPLRAWTSTSFARSGPLGWPKVFMNSYQCLVNGQNFFLNLDGKPKKYGFYKTVYVDSSNPNQAELDAVEYIRNGELKEQVRNSIDDPPMVIVEEMYELEKSGVEENTSRHCFYKEKKWWQFWK